MAVSAHRSTRKPNTRPLYHYNLLWMIYISYLHNQKVLVRHLFVNISCFAVAYIEKLISHILIILYTRSLGTNNANVLQ